MKNTLEVTFRDISFSSPSASCISFNFHQQAKFENLAFKN